MDEIFKIDSNLNIFANFLNEDNDLKKENISNNFNAPQLKSALSKSAFTKTETKDTFKSSSKLINFNVNNSDSNSTSNSKDDYTNSMNTRIDNHITNNNFSLNNVNNINSFNTNKNNKFGNINLKNHSNFDNSFSNIFPNFTNNSFNFAKDSTKLFGSNENNNNSNNFNKNLFSEKFSSNNGIIYKDLKNDKIKDIKPNEEFLNKKIQRDNSVLRKETEYSLLDSNLTNISNVTYVLICFNFFLKIIIL